MRYVQDREYSAGPRRVLQRKVGDDEIHVFAGSTDGAFAALYGYEGRLRGVLGVSMPRMVMPFRALLTAGASWDEALAKAAALTAG